jgi:hypothetical protein
MATNFMNLDLPVVSETLGPAWATQLNAALETIDAHDHSSGKGTKVPTSGININANLNFGGYKPYNLLSLQLSSQSAALSGASHANSVFVQSGNLYFTNGSGTAVQLTSGGSIVSSPAAVESLEYTSVNSSVVIGPSDDFVFIAVDTNAARTITLPSASAVSTGRIYAIKDETGLANGNPITIEAAGSDTIDGEASIDLDSNFGSIWVISNGVDGFLIL